MPKSYPVLEVTEWDTLRWLPRRLPGLVFRGQREVSWGLVPSLERACLPLQDGYSLGDVEGRLVRAFQRAAESFLPYTPRLPSQDSWLEWLALIQHHGGPTRLLDFTQSMYVAAFFAFDEPASGDSAIWAIDPQAIRDAARSRLADCGVRVGRPSEVVFNETLDRELDAPAALVATPSNLNQRMTIQQGVFVCGLNLNRTLEENLFGMLEIDPKRDGEVFRSRQISVTDREFFQTIKGTPVIKIVISRSLRAEVLHELTQMNINHSSLFPGLDGYARDLKRHAFWYSSEAAAMRHHASPDNDGSTNLY
jgi:hypothetical protein